MLYCFNSEIKFQFIKSMIYIALFRGINVGGNNKVEMKKLKSLLERTGFENVVTLLLTVITWMPSAERYRQTG